MNARLVVSPARDSSGGFLVGLVDASLYDNDQRYIRDYSDLTMAQAKSIATANDAEIEANGRVVWPVSHVSETTEAPE